MAFKPDLCQRLQALSLHARRGAELGTGLVLALFRAHRSLWSFVKQAELGVALHQAEEQGLRPSINAPSRSSQPCESCESGTPSTEAPLVDRRLR